MKVLLHCNYDPFESRGGIETVCRDIASYIKHEHEVTIIASGSNSKKYEVSGINVQRLKSLLFWCQLCLLSKYTISVSKY